MEPGNIQNVNIENQMKDAFLDYAMSVIVSRALPDARDGLKPVHRRILYSMYDMGIRATGSYKKSARIVGEVLGKYHPHGDQAVYDAMARMAQDFSLRYLLVDGQGNFGSVDGDPPAAMRYTEARLSKMAEEMLLDIEKETIDHGPNFDDSLQEPLVLPSRLPNLLLNGTSGIAVGMATSIPPHNLGELSTAINYLIDHYNDIDEVSTEKLMEFITGPDFPTGGLILGREGIVHAYGTGKGRIVMRGVAQIEEMKGGRHRIVVTEIPYQVNKTSLIERIAELARDDKLGQISDLRDESDQRGMSIVIELKRGAQPKKVLNQLYKYTQLQSTFSVQLLALVNGEPRTLTLKKALHLFIEHRLDVITRRSEFELRKARAREHILDGLLIALANIDDVIKLIREAENVEAAKTGLMTRFKLSEIQSQAILDMQLRRLAALERMKIEEEARQIREQIAYLEDLLANPVKILGLIKDDMHEITEKYGDERRTRIVGDAENLTDEDLVQDEAVLITLTERGYIKRTNSTTYRNQGRGGRGVMGHTTRQEDEVLFMFQARTLHTVLFFSDKGKVYSEKVYQIPEADRTAKGSSIYNLLNLEAGERITATLPVSDFEAYGYCIMTTTKGRMKRVALNEFSSVRNSGLIAISLREGDSLEWARLCGDKEEAFVVTEQGRALRFSVTDIRVMGRSASGVQSIRLGKDDIVTSMDISEPGGKLLVITQSGVGKQTPLEDYNLQNRGGQGAATIDRKAIARIGKVVAARVVQKEDDLTIISANGIVLRLKVKDIKESSRSTKGVKLINLGEGDSVVSVARIRAADLVTVAKEEGTEVEKPSDVLLESEDQIGSDVEAGEPIDPNETDSDLGDFIE